MQLLHYGPLSVAGADYLPSPGRHEKVAGEIQLASDSTDAAT